MRVAVRCLLLISFFLMACNPKNSQKKLEVSAIPFEGTANPQKVSQLLEKHAALHHVDELNWQAFPYQPQVSFRIAYRNDEIWLKFYVREQHILALRTETNSNTHRDSCVEFFFDPTSQGPYYNFEINPIGTVHLAYGPGPGLDQREFVDPSIITSEIEIHSTLGNQPFKEITGDFSWELTLIIPTDLLVHHKGLNLKGLRAKANFYKCGDDTSQPHYLSWNPVATERPNFHKPEFFGDLIFE